MHAQKIINGLIVLLLPVTNVFAQFIGGTLVTPSVYTVHISALAFAKAGGGIVPFHTGTSDFDIAAAAAGGTIGNYGQGEAMTPGTYSGMQFTMGRSMTVIATGVDQSQTCHTAAGLGTIVYNGMTISQGSTDSSVPTTAQEISIPVSSIITNDLERAGLTVLADGSLQGVLNFSSGNKIISSTNQTMKLNFNVTNAVELFTTGAGTCVILPNAPSLTVE